MNWKNISKLFIVFFILSSIYLCAYPVLHNDLGYNTDIARDFLILQDVINTHKLTLIGPRTGGIDGLFHGPLWPWINLPVFVLGNGNPVAIGWFWVFLISCSVATTYYVGKKVFNDYVGLLSALIVSLMSVQYSSSLLNPFGAILFSPLFFYFFYKYIKSEKPKYLLSAFFVTGLLIQFEVAFGGPILILSLIYLFLFLYKKKKLKHLFSMFILVIPLSTYILFDLRHNFLQIRSIFMHIGSETGSGKVPFSGFVQNRIDGLLNSILSIPYAPFLLTLSILLLFAYIGVKSYRDKKLKDREFYLLFIYFYLGYWPLSFYLNGYVLGFHVLPFVPIAIIIFSSSYLFIRKEIFLIIFLCALWFNFIPARNKVESFASNSGNSAASWKFNYQLAKTVFKNAPSEFGYYVFTPDEQGYGPRYALTYTNKAYPNIVIYSNTKKHVTNIIMAPPINGENNNREWWIKNRVRINEVPVSTISYNNGYKVEKYILTDEEMKVPSDPNLVNGLFFR